MLCYSPQPDEGGRGGQYSVSVCPRSQIQGRLPFGSDSICRPGIAVRDPDLLVLLLSSVWQCASSTSFTFHLFPRRSLVQFPCLTKKTRRRFASLCPSSHTAAHRRSLALSRRTTAQLRLIGSQLILSSDTPHYVATILLHLLELLGLIWLLELCEHGSSLFQQVIFFQDVQVIRHHGGPDPIRQQPSP